MKHALTIAGSDSCAGAGIQADLKTFAALGVYGLSVITAVTAQNTLGVSAVHEIPPEMVGAQLEAIFNDIRVDAVKIGMVANAGIIKIIARYLDRLPSVPVILDPVMVAKSGDSLLAPSAEQALVEYLLPRCTLVTPNIPEASKLTGEKITGKEAMLKAARAIHSMGASNVLVKGGHLSGPPVDILFDGHDFWEFEGTRIETKNTHGTGCTYSSAIAAFVARGLSLFEAIREAKEYTIRAIQQAFALGQGCGPIHHFHPFYKI